MGHVWGWAGFCNECGQSAQFAAEANISEYAGRFVAQADQRLMAAPLESDDNRVTKPRLAKLDDDLARIEVRADELLKRVSKAVPTCGPAEWFDPVVNTVGYCHLVTKHDTTGSWAEAFAATAQRLIAVGSEKPEKDVAPTELRPPPEHAGKSWHWLTAPLGRVGNHGGSCFPAYWDGQRWSWFEPGPTPDWNGYDGCAAPYHDGYRYLGPAEWRPYDAANIVTIERERIAALEAENAELRAYVAKLGENALGAIINSERRVLTLEAEITALKAERRTLMASAARPLLAVEAPSLPTSHAACRHCGTAFLSEVVAAHEASCELRPAADEVVF